jgi:hypothetical protein
VFVSTYAGYISGILSNLTSAVKITMNSPDLSHSSDVSSPTPMVPQDENTHLNSRREFPGEYAFSTSTPVSLCPCLLLTNGCISTPAVNCSHACTCETVHVCRYSADCGFAGVSSLACKPVSNPSSKGGQAGEGDMNWEHDLSDR